jgi:hypothetical protein
MTSERDFWDHWTGDAPFVLAVLCVLRTLLSSLDNVSNALYILAAVVAFGTGAIAVAVQRSRR